MFGPVHFKCKLNGNMITIRDGERAEGTPIVASPKRSGGNAHQRWSMDPAGNGWHFLVSGLDGSVIGTADADPQAGAALISQKRDANAANQLWAIAPLGNALFHLKNKASGLVIEVEDGGRGDGVRLVARAVRKPRADSQVWSYIAASGPSLPPKPTGGERPAEPGKPTEPPLRAYVTPILSVSDLVASVQWFLRLGWHLEYTTSAAGGFLARDHLEGANFAFIKNGYGQLFLSLDGQGLRGDPVAPGAGDDVGATWHSWWVDSVAALEDIHQHAVADHLTVVAAPEDKPWGQRELRLGHPDGHVIRVCTTSSASPGAGDIASPVFVSPILNVADAAAAVRWFKSLGWELAFANTADGSLAAADAALDDGSLAFACIKAGHGQIFLSQDSQGERGGKPPAPGGGDDVGATWQAWWLDSPAGLDALHRRAVAAGVMVVAPPEDRPGQREMRLAYLDGHVFRVLSPLA